MTVDDQEIVFIHFYNKTMFKTLDDCIMTWPEHTNPHDPIIANDVTFNVTTSRNNTVLLILAMDCNNKY